MSSKRPPTSSEQDPAMAAYLASLDLKDLTLDETLLQAHDTSDTWWLALGGIIWVAIVGGLLWLPSTLFYQLDPLAEFAYMGLWALLILLTAALWRSVWTVSQQIPWATANAWLEDATWPTGWHLSPKRQRQALLLGIVTFGGLLALVMPRDVQWEGKGYTGGWFMATFCAIGTGILVGRFLIAHAASRPALAPKEPFVWPRWVRWLNLALLLTGGITVLVLHETAVPGDTRNEFPLACAGLGLGIWGAIWLAKRFDEWEAKWKREAQERQRKQ
jgi:hypothetical protein